MATLNHYDRMAIMVDTPVLGPMLANLFVGLDPATPLAESRRMTNDILETQGWNRFATPDDAVELWAYFNPDHDDNRDYEASYVLDVDDGALQMNQAQPKGNTTVSIEKITYVNGVDIKHMSVDNFLGAIKDTDAEIKRLTEMGIDSVAVNSAINKLKDTKDNLVKLLDEQHADDDAE